MAVALMMAGVLFHFVAPRAMFAAEAKGGAGPAETGLRVATFDVDATPPVGSQMAYDPVKRLSEMTLRCRGIAILGAGQPIVVCSVDWISISNEGQDAFRAALAEAAGTVPDRVAVHTVHQHDAPSCDFTAERILRELGLKDCGRFEGTFQREVIRRAADALRQGLREAQTVTHYGWAAAEVRQVASNRRIKGPDGRVRATRFTATKDPALRAEPEGLIDPEVSLLAFLNENVPVAVLTYYACHPQSYYRTGVPSPDFPGIARFFRGQSVPEALHVHFTGAGGNIGAGKYNDGSPPNRIVLAERLADGMKRAFESMKKAPLTPSDVGWQTLPVALPLAKHLDEEQLVKALKTEPLRGTFDNADRLAWVRRCKSGHRVPIGCLRVGTVRVLHMPGELLVEYQLAAKAMRKDLHVMMAAYGECGPGYIALASAYAEGGYETSPGASNVAPEVEPVLMDAMRQLLDAKP